MPAELLVTRLEDWRAETGSPEARAPSAKSAVRWCLRRGGIVKSCQLNCLRRYPTYRNRGQSALGRPVPALTRFVKIVYLVGDQAASIPSPNYLGGVCIATMQVRGMQVSGVRVSGLRTAEFQERWADDDCLLRILTVAIAAELAGLALAVSAVRSARLLFRELARQFGLAAVKCDDERAFFRA